MEIFSAHISAADLPKVKGPFNKPHLGWRAEVFANLFGDIHLNTGRSKNGKTENILNTLDFDFRPFVSILFQEWKGCKIIASHVHPDSTTWEALLQPNVKFILLERDVIDACCSFKLANSSSIWHVVNTEQAKPVKDVATTVTLADFDWYSAQYVEMYLAMKERIRQSCDTLLLEYESMIENWDDQMQEVQKFLGITQQCLPQPLIKRSAQPHYRNIVNYEQLILEVSDRYPALTKERRYM
jgi:hypothetical protein